MTSDRERIDDLLKSENTNAASTIFAKYFSSAPDNERASIVADYSIFFSGELDTNPLSAAIEAFDSAFMQITCQLSLSERIALHGICRACHPRRTLEIGRARGGSTTLIASAALAIPDARFVSLDPNTPGEHCMNPKLREKLTQTGVIFIDGFSPNENANATKLAGGKFDFAFVDGDHSFESCRNDLLGLTSILEKDALVLLHDARYPAVADAIKDVVNSTSFIDCGLIGRDANEFQRHVLCRGKPTVWGGLHMLRYNTSKNTGLLQRCRKRLGL